MVLNFCPAYCQRSEREGLRFNKNTDECLQWFVLTHIPRYNFDLRMVGIQTCCRKRAFFDKAHITEVNTLPVCMREQKGKNQETEYTLNNINMMSVSQGIDLLEIMFLDTNHLEIPLLGLVGNCLIASTTTFIPHCNDYVAIAEKQQRLTDLFVSNA